MHLYEVYVTVNHTYVVDYPYVSMRFIILFFQGNEIAEDDIVIPLSRS